jgi:hypothetical protein
MTRTSARAREVEAFKQIAIPYIAAALPYVIGFVAGVLVVWLL